MTMKLLNFPDFFFNYLTFPLTLNFPDFSLTSGNPVKAFKNLATNPHEILIVPPKKYTKE